MIFEYYILHSGNEPNLVVMYYPFYILLDSLLNILFRIFASLDMRNILVGSDIKVILAAQNELGGVPFIVSFP